MGTRPSDPELPTSGEAVREVVEHLQRLREIATSALRRGDLAHALIALQFAEHIEAQLGALVGLPTATPAKAKRDPGERSSLA